jgi:large subunit ribosomal protein L10
VARGLNALIAGVAIALSQVNEKKQSGELPAGRRPRRRPGRRRSPSPSRTRGRTGHGHRHDDQDAEPPEPATTTEDPAEGPATTDATPQEN